MDITRKRPYMDEKPIDLVYKPCSRMRSEGFSFYFGRLRVETCSLDAALPFATVHKRPQTVRNHLQ